MNIIPLISLQVEVAKDLLTTTDITIAGLLLAVIAMLIYFNREKEKKNDELNIYIREQDKETLKVLLELTNTLKSSQQVSLDVKRSISTIDNTVSSNNNVLNSLSNIIQNKIINMR